MLLALASPMALAAGFSTDIELVRPYFSGGTLPGQERPAPDAPGTLRFGTLVQYERDPLLLYRQESEVGAVVHNRVVGHMGFSVDLTRRLGARIVVPAGGQWGSEVDRLAADVAGFGDLGLGARFLAVEAGPVQAGLHADALFPFGTADAWLGEQSMRAVAGVAAEAKAGPIRGLADVSITGREAIDTREDFQLGSELGVTLGAMLDVWPDRLSLGAAALTRGGLAHLWEGGAENPVEVLAGATIAPVPAWSLDVGFGRGVAPGYGTTQFRAYGGLTYTHRKQERVAPPEPVARVEIESPPEIPDVVFEPEPPPKPRWKADELARVEEKEIVIRDPIQFELGTDRILPESLPTLRAISKLMADNPEIAHLVIEGHASEEGDYLYNYDLSVRRALAIFRALIDAGVHPGRLSCRGMGEVVPVAQGTEESALAANRRVIFHIVRRLHAGDATPQMPGQVRLPWTGEAATFPTPQAPAPAPPAEEERRKPKDDDRTDPDVFRDDHDDDKEEP